MDDLSPGSSHVKITPITAEQYPQDQLLKNKKMDITMMCEKSYEKQTLTKVNDSQKPYSMLKEIMKQGSMQQDIITAIKWTMIKQKH